MKRRKRRWRSVPKLEMAAMIDVVFLLLVFFLVTVNPVDTLSHLDASRPRFEGEPDLSTLRIGVWQPGIVITCSGDSPHEGLVQALDLCAKNGLRKLSVASTP
jgi:biopolymer transport protein ExbD